MIATGSRCGKGGSTGWAAGAVFLWLSTIVLCLGVTAAAFADTGSSWVENQVTLLEAVNRGDVSVEFTATGSIGVALSMSISSKVDVTLAVSINPGLLLGCSIPGVQRFVVRSPVEFNVGINVKTPRFIKLEPRASLTVELEAYCLDESKRLPDEGTRYLILGMPPRDVQRVLGESIQEGDHPGVCALQAAVWIAHEDLTKQQFEERLGSSCPDVDMTRVVELCDQAGVTPDASWFRKAGPTDPESVWVQSSSDASSEILLWILVGFAVILLGILESL